MTSRFCGKIIYLSIFIGLIQLRPLTKAITIPTSGGDVEGINVTYGDVLVTQYLGIPYAIPPLGDLRFRRPQPHSGWNGTLMATQFGPSCIQYIFDNDAWLLKNKNISEDCLQLNVFVPHLLNGTSRKAVMVWIHGGGFMAGQATLFDASYLAIQGDVIVVTINYRLGIFGFLYTGDVNAPGNDGLYDQRLAIQWVKDNIERFGGDAQKICIFGESAGGFSVGYQSLAPQNKGLFQRAIFESGTVPWLKDLEGRTVEVAEKLGHLVNCSVIDTLGKRNTKQLVECLKTVSSKRLLEAQGPAGSVGNELSFIRKIGPVIDGEIVTGNPMDLMTLKSSAALEMFTSIDILAGTNNAEGGLLFFDLLGFQKQYNFNASVSIPVKVLCDLIAPAVARDYYDNNTNVSSAICDQYKINGSSTDQTRNIVNVFADFVFIVPTVLLLQAHSLSEIDKKTFQYLFSHQPTDPWIQNRPPWLVGANHAGELPFVFGLDAMYRPTAPKPENEMHLSSKIMKYWSNFAKYGDPNGPGLPQWRTYNKSEKSYMDLNIPLSAKQDLYAKRMDFWLETIPNIVNDSYVSSVSQPVTVFVTRDPYFSSVSSQMSISSYHCILLSLVFMNFSVKEI